MHLCSCGQPIKSKRAEQCKTCTNRLNGAKRAVALDEQYFLDRCTVTATGCWEWNGTRLPVATSKSGGKSGGYGTVGAGRKQFGEAMAHRLAWRVLVDPSPIVGELDHLCRNPPCCNPAHLEPVTHQVNMLRAPHIAKAGTRTHCPEGHEIAGANLLIHAKGTRRCRTCAYAYARAYYKRRADAKKASLNPPVGG